MKDYVVINYKKKVIVSYLNLHDDQ
jgi:hypothetical protein